MKNLLILTAFLLVLLAIVILVLLWKYSDNTTLQLTTYQITSNKLPSQFHGFRIAQISDLHNTEFGEQNTELLSLLRESNPDIIVFTGDQIDARRKNLDVAVAFAKEAVQIAPCYLVSGNHEGSIVEFSQLQADLEAVGVTILADETLELEHNGGVLTLMGLKDPTLDDKYFSHGPEGVVDLALSQMTQDLEGYTVLLAHHPEYLPIYQKYGIDLALCGHVHGGQIRLGDQGLLAPDQGFFPKYDSGLYTEGNTTMVISRGLGNSRFPWRVNNPPEVVMVEFISDTNK